MHLNYTRLAAQFQTLDAAAFAIASAAALMAYRAAKLYPMGKGFEHIPVSPQHTKGLTGFLLGNFSDELTFEGYRDVFEYLFKVHCPEPLKRVARLRTIRRNWIVCSHPADVYHIQVVKGGNYTKPDLYKQLLGRVLGDGILTQVDVKKHAFHRRNMAPAFSPSALKYISDAVMAKHALYLVDNIRKHIAESNGKPFVVQEDISEATVQVMAEAVFKTKNLEDTKYLVTAFRALITAQWNMLRVFPFVDCLLFSANRTIAEGLKVLGARAKKIAEDTKKQGSGRADKAAPQALIDYLIFTQKYSAQHILDHSVTFILAGHDTTNNTLNWFTLLMAKNPSVQEKLYEELCDAIGKNKQCKLDDLKGCKYFTNCIKETLRLRGVAASVSKVALEDDVLPGTKTFIPKGTSIDLNLASCLHNKDIWGADAEEYRPERWEEIPEEKRDMCELAFIPFSSGPRSCIGKEFAMNEMHLLAAAMVRNFEFVWPEDEPEPKVWYEIVVRPKDLLHLIVRERTE